MKKLHPAEQYVEDVLSGKMPACKWVKLACERYKHDRAAMLTHGWKFDERSAQRSINFYERILKHYQDEWAGKPFLLLPWQQFIIWNLDGWYNADGSRRFSQVSIFVPRKNGKTELASGRALYGMGFDGEKAAEVYSTATDKDQAKIAFEKAKQMVRQSDMLMDSLDTLAQAISGNKFGSTFKPWSSDTSKKDGYSPSFAIVDEYHEHPDNRMMDVIKSGMGARRNPIIFMVTTAGFNTKSVAYKHQQVCEDVLEGKKKQDNLFTIIYTIDKDDNWEDPSSWIKANPSWYAITTMHRQMENAYQDAKNSGDNVNFKTKHLNMWVKAAEVWIEEAKWEACGDDYTLDDLLGEKCYGGLDLSDSFDITSLCLNFPDSNRQLWWFWLPEDAVNKQGNNDHDDYWRWVEDGWIITTPGNVIDYDHIRRTISGYSVEDGQVRYDPDCIAQKYNLQSIGYDPWNSKQLAIRLSNDDGIQMNIYRQGFQTMSFPTKEWKKGIYGSTIHHNNNPVMNWMVGNCTVRRDPNDNIMLDKSKSKNKIDGAVAAVIAHGEVINSESVNNAYQNYGVRSV
jgi:phage terminase large subunit-like protein